MIMPSTITIDVTDYRWGRIHYDAAELDRNAAAALSQASPGCFVRVVVGDLEPAPVPESFSWVRGDLIYDVNGSFPRVNAAWEAALSEAEVVNHGR